MCGIAGYMNLGRNDFCVDDALLQNMQKSLAHRGPNGYGIWKSATYQIALVHRRLSIIDLSNAGNQPMLDRDRSVVISFNGEIYNYRALKNELEKKGYIFTSRSDTETLLYAYKEWGIQFLDRLEGMFAIALFDLQRNELYLIRDRMGVKPLYFSLQGQILSFASEIKALWQLPWITKKINKSSLSHYLTFLATPAPSTLFEGVYKLPASFYVKIDTNRNLTFHEWYTPIKSISLQEKQAFLSESFCVDGIRALLRQSIEKRMIADVPFGVFLSGGIDSSLNVALMKEYTDNVKTFTVAFSDGPEYDELQWARHVAKYYNTEHHEVIISEKEAFDFFERMVYHQDEPLADRVCIPLYYVAKLLKDAGVTVVQVGEGSDEIFCGYDLYAHYLNLYNNWERSQRFVPAIMRASLSKVAACFMQSSLNRIDMLNNWADGKNLFWSGAVAFSEHWKKQIVNFTLSDQADPIVDAIYPGLRLWASSYEVVEYHLKKLRTLSAYEDFLASMIYLELKQRLPELLLTRIDKMTMATGVEARVPFLDHKLVEFALHIPSALKYKNGITKYILKKAATGILPDDIIYRKKMGFASPSERWLKKGNYFKPYFQDLLAKKRENLQEYFDVNALETLFEKNCVGDKDYSVQLWTLQNLIALDVL